MVHRRAIRKIKVPGFHIAAWYDLFQDGTLKNYQGIKAQGGSEAARNNQKLLVLIVGGHAGLRPKSATSISARIPCPTSLP